jgi:hypothetical protein
MLVRRLAPSRLHGRAVFVLAPPGSGADAVAAALTALRGVAPAGVTELFSDGIPGLVGNFVVGQHVGLSAVWTEDEFLEASRDLADDLLDPRQLGHVVVDASPGEAEWVEVIALLYADATFVRVVRDVREVASAAGWRPRAAYRAARQWHAAHRCLAEAAVSPRFPELGAAPGSPVVVAVDELRADPAGQLRRITERLPIEPSDDELAAAAAVLARNLPPRRVRLVGRVAAALAR